MKSFSQETPISRKHREAMRNILLLFAKPNPAIQYVQGMNEVFAPLYYVFSTDINEKNAANAEADSFACFVHLLSDSVDHFCQQLDSSSVSILSTLYRLSDLLRANDEELRHHLEFTTKMDYIATDSRIRLEVHLKNMGFLLGQSLWHSEYAAASMLCDVALRQELTAEWRLHSQLEASSALSPD